MKRIAINGLGRIGKLAFQYILESEDYKNGKVDIVAINDLTDVYQLYMLLKHDSTQVTLSEKGHKVSYRVRRAPAENEESAPGWEDLKGYLIVDGKEFPVFAQPDPTKLPWGMLNVDVVCECTGRFATKEAAHAHIVAGAKHVMVNSPVKEVPNIVFNVNSNELTGSEEIFCGASCTTNCLSPLAKILEDKWVIGMMDTIHAYTADQTLLDTPHKKGADSRRGRCAAENITPASTGAAEAVAKAIPSLKGKMTGMAFRVPVPTGSVVSLTVVLKGVYTAEEVNDLIKSSVDHVAIDWTDEPIVSTDIIGIEFGSYVDTQLTKTLEFGDNTLVKLVAWYDNEASYTHQYVKTLLHFITLF